MKKFRQEFERTSEAFDAIAEEVRRETLSGRSVRDLRIAYGAGRMSERIARAIGAELELREIVIAPATIPTHQDAFIALLDGRSEVAARMRESASHPGAGPLTGGADR